MLIQNLAPCDPIVAPEQAPADFCNNIGQERKSELLFDHLVGAG
jgi:hypothetical protein